MRAVLLGILAAGLLAACTVGRHLAKEIPPPGGCDQCHRLKISGNWELSLAPVPLGRDGGIPEDKDVVLNEVSVLPFHREVPAKRLAVYVASARPEAVGTAETGIQCFICHKSPGPPHESLRGSIPPPWGRDGAVKP
jgi:hypothetical protein